MTAYLIVRALITDESRFAEYRRAVVPLIESFGGKHVRSGPVELLEGDPSDFRIALFEFSSMDAIRAFWNSPQYQPMKKIREGAAELTVWAIPVSSTS